MSAAAASRRDLRPVAVINIVGLSRGLLGESTPRLTAHAGRGAVHTLEPILPAVTCSAQATMLTGLPPRDHGIVGNGWFDRTLNEVHFWKQSNALVAGEKVWETMRLRAPSATCANCFWWFNMYSSADVALTPRPMYPADGRKLPDIWTEPAEWRRELQEQLGPFPLFKFWGPASSIESSEWIARAAIATQRRFRPTLTLVYLPHLDYPLQRVGPAHPSIPEELGSIDRVVGTLLDAFEESGTRVLVVSEYGIEAAEAAIPINRILREEGMLALRDELGRECLDAGASRAFAVADHQVAHLHVRAPGDLARVAERCRREPGVATVLDAAGKAAVGLDHARSGDLILVAERGFWFSYGWWMDDRRAPDYARTVDIHRKPGYDPAELLLDPAIRAPRLRIGWTLLKRRLGFRAMMDVVPLNADLVRGTHGRIPEDRALWPILIAPRSHGPEKLPLAAVREIILRELEP
jgi:predicted AlkP superfamily pyrophosphatase or phosphodiesterase